MKYHVTKYDEKSHFYRNICNYARSSDQYHKTVSLENSRYYKRLWPLDINTEDICPKCVKHQEWHSLMLHILANV